MRFQPYLAVPTLLVAAALSADAQNGASGSESWLSSARNAPSSGGSSRSESISVESELGFATAGPPATSESFAFQGGAVWTGAGFDPVGPVVFGLADAKGHAAGGETEVVLGLGFQEPGAGATTVAFDGVAGGGVVVLGDTQLTVVSPPGTNLVGNPKGRVDVSVANAYGSSQASGAYTFTPAITQAGVARIGKTFHVLSTDEPGALEVLAYGKTVPGVTVPVFPYSGVLELILASGPLSGVVPVPNGFGNFAIPVPPLASLVGGSVDLQMLSLSTLVPGTGSFSNTIQVTVEG